MQLSDALRLATDELVASGVQNAENEARWMLCEITGWNAMDMRLNQHCVLQPAQTTVLQDWLKRRCDGEPFQYILGNTDFFGMTFSVGPGVLVPRPETELLVEQALKIDLPDGDICDVCTGSGAVAIVLAKHFSTDRRVYATEINGRALDYASANSHALGCASIRLVQADLLSCFSASGQFSMIVANPPYVSQTEFQRLASEVRDYEPQIALLADDDGLDLYKRLIPQAWTYLTRQGVFMTEIGWQQGECVAELCRNTGFSEVQILKDLQGLDRIVKGVKEC
jgi:release factor glutamine methyltransferase